MSDTTRRLLREVELLREQERGRLLRVPLAGVGGAGSGDMVRPCWVTSSCLAATKTGSSVSSNTVDVLIGSCSGASVSFTDSQTAYWDSTEMDIHVTSGYAKGGWVVKIGPDWRLMVIDCTEFAL